MTALKFSAGIQVAPGGPAMSLATAIEIEAYTKIEFVLTDTAPANTKTLNLGVLGDTLKVVVIKSDLNDFDVDYKPALTYTAGKGFSLDAPHIYLGAGFVQSLAGAGIDFTNVTFTFTPLTSAQIKKAQDEKKTVKDVKSAKVEILVGGPTVEPAKPPQ
ncbi:hypothetical protein J5X98_19435 [Leptothermofonsia sichuanensis E412]|uniref:hypothetical protein n=1 Tax=Leptothermofonsia sichuanensis TaxID=2917832 RepID=UPI001CA6922A|nr:hypothetical protein [Leptothermofonsia sichuanensis]QZZ19505.1 hypothetical protein J5X98_19435 [Leptothermofonsia sichuanensis E412]